MEAAQFCREGGARNSKLFQLCTPGIFVFFSHSLDFQALKTPVPLEFQACKSLSPLEFHYFVGGPCNFDVFPTPLESQSLNVSTPLGISRSQSYKFVPNCPITLIFPIPPFEFPEDRDAICVTLGIPDCYGIGGPLGIPRSSTGGARLKNATSQSLITFTKKNNIYLP